jgi:hypothetical protein
MSDSKSELLTAKASGGDTKVGLVHSVGSGLDYAGITPGSTLVSPPSTTTTTDTAQLTPMQRWAKSLGVGSGSVSSAMVVDSAKVSPSTSSSTPNDTPELTALRTKFTTEFTKRARTTLIQVENERKRIDDLIAKRAMGGGGGSGKNNNTTDTKTDDGYLGSVQFELDNQLLAAYDRIGGEDEVTDGPELDQCFAEVDKVEVEKLAAWTSRDCPPFDHPDVKIEEVVSNGMGVEMKSDEKGGGGSGGGCGGGGGSIQSSTSSSSSSSSAMVVTSSTQSPSTHKKIRVTFKTLWIGDFDDRQSFEKAWKKGRLWGCFTKPMMKLMQVPKIDLNDWKIRHGGKENEPNKPIDPSINKTELALFTDGVKSFPKDPKSPTRWYFCTKLKKYKIPFGCYHNEDEAWQGFFNQGLVSELKSYQKREDSQLKMELMGIKQNCVKDGLGYIYIGLNNYEVIVDEEWFSLMNIETWCLKSGYAFNYRMGFMHKYLLHEKQDGKAIPAGMVGDHINGNPLDNRMQNLRIVSKHQNCLNHKRSVRNTSGHTGVYYHKRDNKWTAQIVYNRQRIYLGRFKDYDLAVHARQEAQKKYYGQYARGGNAATEKRGKRFVIGYENGEPLEETGEMIDDKINDGDSKASVNHKS